MYLYINTFTQPHFIGIFDTQQILIDQMSWDGKQKEFDTLIKTIDTLLSKNSISYSELEGIVCINWPGGFTGTRVTTLVVNTIAFSYQIPLFAFGIFDFFAKQDAPYPYITSITKRECLLWKNRSPDPELAQINTLPEWIYSALEDIDTRSNLAKIILVKARNHEKFIKNIVLDTPCKIISPLYAKNPNITLIPSMYVQ